MGRETSPLQLLASLLLTGGKGADLVIRGNVVLNTLSTRSTSTLLRDQISINFSPSRQILRPSRTVLRDRFRFLYVIERYEIDYIVLKLFIGRIWSPLRFSPVGTHGTATILYLCEIRDASLLLPPRRDGVCAHAGGAPTSAACSRATPEVTPR
jgi:hypothetical protein